MSTVLPSRFHHGEPPGRRISLGISSRPAELLGLRAEDFTSTRRVRGSRGGARRVHQVGKLRGDTSHRRAAEVCSVDGETGFAGGFCDALIRNEQQE